MSTTATPIRLEVHLCAKRRSIIVGFATDEQAAAYIERKSSTCAFHELDEAPVPDWATETLAALNPTCEHGLSLALCAGPMHYPDDSRW